MLVSVEGAHAHPMFMPVESKNTTNKESVVVDFGSRYLQVHKEFTALKQSLGFLKRWIWLHQDDFGLLGLVARLFASISSSFQRELERMDFLQLHTACYQHFAKIKQKGLGIPGAPQSRDFEDPFLCTEKTWQKTAEEIALGKTTLEKTDIRFRSDREIVLLAVEKDGCALQFASGVLKADRDIVRAAVLQNSLALQYASKALGIDPQVTQTSIEQNAAAAKLATNLAPASTTSKLWQDAFDAVCACGMNLYNYSEEIMPGCYFTNDKKIVMAAVQQDGRAFQYASDDLKNDKDVVLAAVSENGMVLENVNDDFKGDKKIVMAAVNRDGGALFHASDELKADKDIVWAAFQKNRLSFKFASSSLRGDKVFVLPIVKIFGKSLECVSEELRADPQIVAAAIAQNIDAAVFSLVCVK